MNQDKLPLCELNKISYLGITFPWRGHFNRSRRGQSDPLGIGARQDHLTGSNCPEKLFTIF
jgi:hypothetical protein